MGSSSSRTIPAEPIIQESVPLAPMTTIGLGGNAMRYAACETVEHLCNALHYATSNHLPVQVLGGGSNIIFADHGFRGLVINVGLKGTSIDGETVTAAAGEEWDDIVQLAIRNNLGGIECLSGIPGRVGAAPIQNVGAYGQEVSDTITSVRVLDRESLTERILDHGDCNFSYRQSRFKSGDANRFIVLAATFRLHRDRVPAIRYPELQKALDADSTTLTLDRIRSSVIQLRKSKSMILDPSDPNSRSVGSFFLNPVITGEEFAVLETNWKSAGERAPVPSFDLPDGMKKIPAAWLVERAGFTRGYRRGNAAISSRHTLALVNSGTTTRELLDLAAEIRTGVHRKFGITLEREPVVVD